MCLGVEVNFFIDHNYVDCCTESWWNNYFNEFFRERRVLFTFTKTMHGHHHLYPSSRFHLVKWSLKPWNKHMTTCWSIVNISHFQAHHNRTCTFWQKNVEKENWIAEMWEQIYWFCFPCLRTKQTKQMKGLRAKKKIKWVAIKCSLKIALNELQ